MEGDVIPTHLGKIWVSQIEKMFSTKRGKCNRIDITTENIGHLVKDIRKLKDPQTSCNKPQGFFQHTKESVTFRHNFSGGR